MKAPALKPEVKPALSPHLMKKEFYQVAAQSQLAAATSVTGSELTEALTNETVDKEKLIGSLSDTGRILTDLQHTLSVARRARIIPTINPFVKSMAEVCSIDTMLFGEGFSERFKAAQALEKSSKAMINSTATTRRTTATAGVRPTSAPTRSNGDSHRLNSKGLSKKAYGSYRQGGQAKSRQTSQGNRRPQ